MLGGLGLLYLAVYWIVAQIISRVELMPLHQRPAVLYSLGALLLGGQLMSIGFLAELITAYQFRDADTYSIAERSRPIEPTRPRTHLMSHSGRSRRHSSAGASTGC